jgi:hypothetical protein
MGGYVGFRSFVAVVHDGAVVYTDVDSGDYGLIGAQCQKAIANGIIPVGPLIEKAATVVAPPPPQDGFAPMLGLQFTDDPTGVRISAVTPGSVAEAAGLTDGIVVQKINGVGLASLDFGTKAKLFEAAEAGATLSGSDGKDFVIKRPAPVALSKPPATKKH